MYLVMTICAQRNQVLLTIVSLTTSETHVVDLEILARAADLTLPTIALQHPLAQLLVRHGVEPHSGPFWKRAAHDAFSWTNCSRNICLCWVGRNLTNWKIDCRSASGVALSRFAPARKSAQIISKQ